MNSYECRLTSLQNRLPRFNSGRGLQHFNELAGTKGLATLRVGHTSVIGIRREPPTQPYGERRRPEASVWLRRRRADHHHQ
jgi:hypothetical protein